MRFILSLPPSDSFFPLFESERTGHIREEFARRAVELSGHALDAFALRGIGREFPHAPQTVDGVTLVVDSETVAMSSNRWYRWGPACPPDPPARGRRATARCDALARHVRASALPS